MNDRIRVVGEVGRAYGAPRITADEVTSLGRGTSPAPAIVKDVPTAALEWRLATVTGTVDRVTRDGERWRAEIAVGSKRIPVDGLASAGIPASTIVKGSRITLTGIVRRPHPSAVDRRFAIAPRSAADVHVTAGRVHRAALQPRRGPRPAGVPAHAGAPRASGVASPTRLLAPGSTPSVVGGADVIVDVEFATLATAIGRHVRVGGLVVEVRPDAVVVDDGSAQGLVLVAPDAASVLGVLQPGDALNAVGTVVADPELAVHVLDPAGLVPVSAIAPIEEESLEPYPDAAAAEATAPDLGTGEDDLPNEGPDRGQGGASAHGGGAVRAGAGVRRRRPPGRRAAPPAGRRHGRRTGGTGLMAGLQRPRPPPIGTNRARIEPLPCLTLVLGQPYPRPKSCVHNARRPPYEDEILPSADPRVALPVGERQYHIGLGPGELAEYILLPGDPDRTARIAARFDDVELDRHNREFASVTGTFRGQRVSVVSTGIGTDNVEIVIAEILAITDRPTFVRVGSCGALQPEIALGDVIITTGAVRLESTTSYFVHDGYPAVADSAGDVRADRGRRPNGRHGARRDHRHGARLLRRPGQADPELAHPLP